MKTKQTVGIILCLIIVLVLISTAVFASGSSVTLDITDGNVYLRESTGTLQYGRDNAEWTDYTGTLTVMQNGEQTGASGYLQKQIIIISGEHTVAIDNISIKGQSDIGAAIDISAGATLHLILQNSSFLSGSGEMKPGLSVPSGATLIIEEASTGALSASGNDYCAGIGGGLNQSAGTVTIKGGTINAHGGKYGAGIGGGGNQVVRDDIPTDGETIIIENEGGGNGGNVTVDGGTVKAVGGQYSAGIGGGGNQSAGISIGGGALGIGGTYYVSYGTHAGNGGTLTVNGGTVTASSEFKSPGVGGGSNERVALFGTANAGGECGTITINGGIVNATGDNYGSPGIGNGGDGSNSIENCGTLTVNGGRLTAEANNSIDASTGGAAIGGGDDSTGVVGINVIINDGTVRAIAARRSELEDITGLHSIGAGGMGENHGTLTINGGSLYADTTVCPTPKNNNGDTLYPHTVSIGVSDVPLFMDISENTSGLPYAYASRHVYPDADGNAYIYLKSDNITNYTIKSGILRTVTFDADGGTPTHASIAAANGNTVTLPADFGEPVKEGFVFKGWYANASCTGSPFDFSGTTINEDITLYAKWTARYKVSFSAGAKGKTTSASLTVDDGAVINIFDSLGSFTRDNYTCIGLAESDGQQTPVYTSTLTVTKNVTLYPVWKTNLRTVSEDPGSADYYETLGVENSYVGYICIRTAEEFKLLAEYIDGNPFGRNANVILLNDIDFNPGYSLTFIPDTGLVEMTMGTDTVYIGTGMLGTSGTNTQFDYTASKGGYFYSFNGTEYETTEAPSDLFIWTPIDGDGYAGIFDGNNKTISGLYCLDASASSVGIFKTVADYGCVLDLTVENSCLIGRRYVGSVCGINNGMLSNCHNSSIIVGDETVGGVCGVNYSIITQCSNDGSVVAIQDSAGGICGRNGSELKECYNNGEVTGGRAIVGGISGDSYGLIKDCINDAIIRVEGSFSGGVSGANSGEIQSCRNNGTLLGMNISGGICGENTGTVQDCLNNGTVNVSNEIGGGICGWNYNGVTSIGTIKNCLNIGEVIGQNQISSVCGWNDNGKIENCYYLAESETENGARTASQFADGSVTWLLNGRKSEGNVENPLVWYQTLGTDTIPTLDNTHGTVYQGSGYDSNGFKVDDDKNKPYNNISSDNYEPATLNNNGTEEDETDDVYEISNAGQLYWFANQVNTVEGKNNINGKLMNDINLNPGYTFTFEPDTGLVELKNGEEIKGYFGTGIKGESGGTNSTFDTDASDKWAYYSTEYEATDEPDYLRTWTPIGNDFTTYTGDFNGNNHTVSGLYFNDSGRVHVGLFGSFGNHVIYDGDNTPYIENSISNIGVINSYIRGSQEAGGICGRNEGGTISDCYNSGIIIGNNNNIGGVCGWSTGGTITNCYNTGAVNGGNYVGGVCGWNENNSSITNCYNTGAVNGYTYVGGVCGCSTGGTITICYNTGTVNGNTQVGGVCGWNENNSSITNCYNIGAVNGKTDVGSVYGWNNNGQIENCYYLAESDNESDGKTAAQFANGNVAWLLNTNGGSSANSEEWSQGRNYPIFKDDTHKAIYKISVSGAKTADYYTDAEGKCAALETLHGDGISVDTVHSTDTAYTADAAITGVTPTVTDSIRFTYHVTVARDLIPTLNITLGGKTVTLTSMPSGDGDYLNYDFAFEGILPQQMAENIAAKLMISGTQYATKSQYSVKAYVFSQLPASDKTLEKFLVNMLYYGEAAQRHLGRTENLATEGLDALLGEDVIASYRTSDSAWNTLMPETVKAVTDTHEGEIITWKSATLVFDKTITMRLRFTAPDATVIPLDYKFNNTIPFSDAVNEKTEEGITTYYIDITGFTPTDYENVITMTLYNNETTPEAVSEEVTYSVMSYIRSKKDSASMMVLVRALYDYGISGKAYKGV